MTLPRLFWTSAHGQLAHALGVTDTRSMLFDDTINDIVDAGGSIKDIFDALEAIPDVTFNEWTAICFAIGYMDGTR